MAAVRTETPGAGGTGWSGVTGEETSGEFSAYRGEPGLELGTTAPGGSLSISELWLAVVPGATA